MGVWSRAGRGALLGAIAAAAAVAGVATAEPLARQDVPPALAPWVDWALRGAEDARCPFVHGNAERRQCVWPSRLKLVLDDGGGRFRQEWRVYLDAWVPLPGEARQWPQAVRTNGAPAAVVAREGQPSVRVSAGRHVVRGELHWGELPEFVRIPAETGLVDLELRGRTVAFPDRDASGRLWVQKRATEQDAESRLEVVVHRRVADEVPLELETRVELRVSGKGREVVLGRALPPAFVPMRLRSPLPARIEPDGRLRVQVRPGTFELALHARHDGPAAELALPEEVLGAWDAEEVWVFDARNQLRLVRVEGVPAIDPQQTTLPEAWRGLPAYLMKPGSRMRLEQKRRGDEDPAPDQLALERTWWLDFDGGGYTVHDQIQGTLHQSWRLEAVAPTQLGRVAIEGEDQFLSRRNGTGAGFEVRQGVVSIDADSRMEGVAGALPAAGWNHDFQNVSGTLNLPPGWRLFHASGVDDVRSTWTTSWSLFEIFLVLVTSMAVLRLWGRGWGALALVALALTYPEAGAPRWTWLAVIAAHALARAIPEGRLRNAARLARLGAIAALGVIAIPFAVQQARVALYPALEFTHLAVYGDAIKVAGLVRAVADQPATEPALREELQSELQDRLSMSKAATSRGRGLARYYAPDPTALVSTGPGLPHWGWRAIGLRWRGPVKRDQTLRLLLIPPWGNALIAWARVALVALLAACLLDQGPRLRALLRGVSRAGVGALLLASWLTPGVASADIPSAELLEELRERLLVPPDCFPRCASSPRLRIEVTPRTLRARAEIDAAIETAIPLPGGLKQWVPETVLLDGEPASGLARSPDGTLWLPVAPGKHQVILEGGLPDRDSVQLPLPLRPHRVTAVVSGWTLDGVGRDGSPAASLQLTRERDPDRSGNDTLEPSELPPFVRVERRLRLGLSWQVETTVVRATPPGQALFLEVPLLPGESVTTEAGRVEDRIARVELAAGATRAEWTSLLEPSEVLSLRAPDAVPWVEVWHLDVAPVWHVEVEGIPVVHEPAAPLIRVRQWRPWPGETVDLRITRPAGIDGRTLTIDRSALDVTPGLRASDFALALSFRASRGAQHALTLPEGAELQSVSLDDALQPVRAVEGRVVLPIRPGKHTALVTWRGPDGIAGYYATPAVDIGAPSVNAEVKLSVPRDRWVLWIGGPRLGPAVVFWSLLFVALLLALALGQLRWTPLGWGSWLLLFTGLTQVHITVSIVVTGWLLALGWRRENADRASDAAFDGLQLLLAGWTAIALGGLLWAIQQGLLGLPDMQISGNGSSGELLRWYADRSDGTTPTAWLLSVPILVYRLAMLAWALWIARALVAWLRWGWDCFSTGGLWRPLRRRVSPAQP